MAYSAFLGTTSVTNSGTGAVASTTYDSAGRPSTSTSVDGAITTYSYATTFPFTQTATVTKSDHAQGRWTQSTFDGFGRVLKTITADSNGVQQSEVDTVYAPTSCAPLGMATQTSLPYTPGGSASFITSTFDGAGNLLTKTLPDGSVAKYAYSGNSVTVTDPALNWKTITTDIFGNTTSVVEPDPANPTTATYTTSYAYDWVNHLVSVNMGTRNGSTQPGSRGRGGNCDLRK